MTDSADSGDDDVEVSIDDWETVVSNLERFAGERGEVTETDGGVRCDFGNARFEVRTSGTVTAGMPLHDVEGVNATALRFDHANGAVTALAGNEHDDDGERFEYTFRRP